MHCGFFGMGNMKKILSALAMRNDDPQVLNEAYSSFYKAFERFNRVACGGTLPRCVIRFYRGRGGRRVAYAQNSSPPEIAFNLSRCLYFPEEYLHGVLAHEMTNIRQFSLNKNGGHGSDFYKEMSRIGIDEKRGCVLRGSAVDYIFSLNEMYPVSLLNALRIISARSTFSSQEFVEQFFINS